MSEYQYYEFLAVDRPLSGDQQAQLRAMSTRAMITASSFINTYHWGDLKGDPQDLVQEYFDAFLYTANWGTRRLMFRIPSRLLDLATVEQYCLTDAATAWVHGDHLIVDLASEHEGDGYWDEGDGGEGQLGGIIPARADLMAGDLRLLYLGWLLQADIGMLDDDEPEPPVPSGLADLPGALYSAANFLRIDPGLLEAAAEGSEPVESSAGSDGELAAWIAQQTEEDKNQQLLRVVQGEGSFVRADLTRRFRASLEPELSPAAEPQPRTVGELLRRAAQLR